MRHGTYPTLPKCIDDKLYIYKEMMFRGDTMTNCIFITITIFRGEQSTPRINVLRYRSIALYSTPRQVHVHNSDTTWYQVQHITVVTKNGNLILSV